MRMYGRPHAVAVPGQRGDGPDILDHAVPGPVVETGRPITVAGGKIAFVVPPVHDREVGRGKPLRNSTQTLQQLTIDSPDK